MQKDRSGAVRNTTTVTLCILARSNVVAANLTVERSSKATLNLRPLLTRASPGSHLGQRPRNTEYIKENLHIHNYKGNIPNKHK